MKRENLKTSLNYSNVFNESEILELKENSGKDKKTEVNNKEKKEGGDNEEKGEKSEEDEGNDFFK